MKYTIVGADKNTGDDITVIVTATGLADAQDKARFMGLLVSRIEPTESVSEPEPNTKATNDPTANTRQPFIPPSYNGLNYAGLVIAAMAVLGLGVVAIAQVSPDEAMQRIREREAERAAISPATRPAPTTQESEVAELKSIIAAQAAQIDKLKSELAAYVAYDAKLRKMLAANPQAAGSTDEIKDAIARHTLVVGMTLDECNRAMGTTGWITSQIADGSEYEWVYLSVGPPNEKGQKPLLGSREFTGVIENGRLTNWSQGGAESGAWGEEELMENHPR